MILDLTSLSWSRVEVISSMGLPLSLDIHGHTIMCDPLNNDQIFVFGGKKTATASKSLTSKKQKSKWMKSTTCPAPSASAGEVVPLECLMINIQTGQASSLHIIGEQVDARYGHTMVPVKYNSRLTLDRSANNAGFVDGEVVAVVYGGYKTFQHGFCTPDLLELVYNSEKFTRRHAVSSDRMIRHEMIGEEKSFLGLSPRSTSSSSVDVRQKTGSMTICGSPEQGLEIHRSLIKKATLKNLKHAFCAPKTTRTILSPDVRKKIETSTEHSSTLKNMHMKLSHLDSRDDTHTYGLQCTSSSRPTSPSSFLPLQTTRSYSDSLPGSLPDGIYARPRTAPSSRERPSTSANNSRRVATDSAHFFHEKKRTRPLTAPGSRRARSLREAQKFGRDVEDIDLTTFLDHVKKGGINILVARETFVGGKLLSGLEI